MIDRPRCARRVGFLRPRVVSNRNLCLHMSALPRLANFEGFSGSGNVFGTGRMAISRSYKEKAYSAYKSKQYTESKDLYFLTARSLLDLGQVIPLRMLNNYVHSQFLDPYSLVNPEHKADLVAAYVGMGKCLIALGEITEALTWLDEARLVVYSTRFLLPEPLFEWIRYNLDQPLLTKEFAIAMALESKIFELLGNTAMAVERRWNICVESMGERHMTPEVQRIRDLNRTMKLAGLRHPDPKLTATVEVKFSELQVLGSWKKVSVKKKGVMTPRLGFTSFIWNSKLYIGGGLGETLGPCYRDISCLDLEKLDTWRALPPFPADKRHTGVWLCWTFAVHNDKAYLFTGKEELDFFDLRAEKWGSVGTNGLPSAVDMQSNWGGPPLYDASRSTQQVVGDCLYLFGGSHMDTIIGCNLFLQLNFKTMTWRRLSGYRKSGKSADYTCPGPRRTASSWVDPNQERFYLFGGEADRSAGEDKGELHGACSGFPYEDLWSWDLKKESWRLERLAGNIPCPRSEMACTYNPGLDATFVFGGYNPALPTRFDNNHFPFSYFGDTFMYCPATTTSPKDTGTSLVHPSSTSAPRTQGTWKHVLTRGFPTYRAQAQLVTDPATGKMYLFGGYVNTDWVPSGKVNASRTFADLWQLRVDIPGGDFKDVDLEDEAKTAKLGPWQRCFACGSAGRWKKCGGSCKGRAFFCDSDCLREGWKQHKQMHDCRKL